MKTTKKNIKQMEAINFENCNIYTYENVLYNLQTRTKNALTYKDDMIDDFFKKYDYSYACSKGLYYACGIYGCIARVDEITMYNKNYDVIGSVLVKFC